MHLSRAGLEDLFWLHVSCCVLLSELEMPWTVSSSSSSSFSLPPRRCGWSVSTAGQVAVTSTSSSTVHGGIGTSGPVQRRPTTLHTAASGGSWRRPQVCEVRPNRSSTSGRPATTTVLHQQQPQLTDVDDKYTMSTTLPSVPGMHPRTVSSAPSMTVRAPPRPPARSSSSDCCRCRWLRAASNSSPSADPAGRGRDAAARRPVQLGETAGEGDGRLPPPPPPPTPVPRQPVAPSTRDLCGLHLDEFLVSVFSLLLYRGGSGYPIDMLSWDIAEVVSPCLPRGL